MNTSILDFTIAEKLAFVHALDSVVLADGVAHKAELDSFSVLMKYFDFDSNFIVQARNASEEQVLLILNTMTNSKKELLLSMLKEMAIVDGHVHEKETSLITKLYASLNIKEETD